MKQNRLHIAAMTDHAAAAANALKAEGAWVMVTVYRGTQAGDAVARGIRTGRINAWKPAGAYEAYSATHEDGTAVWARALSPLWDVAPMGKKRTVRVPDFSAQRGDEGVQILTVDIRVTCPRCGGPRGPVRPHSFTKGGARLVCDTWTNSCGHQDEYKAVLAEARRIADKVREPQKKGPAIEGVEGGPYQAAVDLLAAALKKQPWLKGEAAAKLLEGNGHQAAAMAARAFIQGSPTRWHTSAKSVALFLMERDAVVASSKEDSK